MANIDCWLSNVSFIPNLASLNKYLSTLPVVIQQHISEHKRFEKKRSRLVGRMLLLEYLAHLGLAQHWEQRLKYNEYGKPFLVACPSFSIAHSGEKVILAVNPKGEIGVDIQEVRGFKELAVFKEYLHPNEWSYLQELSDSQEQARTLIHFWTKREALFKLLGIGMAVSSNNLDCTKNTIVWKSKKYSLVEIELEKEYIGYICFLASKNKMGIDFRSHSF